jgi:hypothetical protein
LNALRLQTKCALSDLWVAFTHRGIPVELADFHLASHPQGINVVVDWVVKYFTPKISPGSNGGTINEALMGASPVTLTDRMPLILQHSGHSRLIVGYEINRSGQVDLLTFDPAQ